MTGYGQARVGLGGRMATVTLRSVNHRHLDVRCRLPAGLAGVESRLRARVRASLGRGKVDVLVYVHGSQAEGGGAAATIDTKAAVAYWDQLVALAGVLGDGAPRPDLGLLVGLPGVVRSDDGPSDPDLVWKDLQPAVDEALERLRSSRRAEGATLVADLQDRVAQLRVLHQAAVERTPEALQDQQQRLRRRAEALLADVGVRLDEGRLAHELVILADRSDVEEELTRLAHHLSTLSTLLAGDGRVPVGRKLDFVLQEAMREANTLGSKSSDSALADVVVEIKAELERVREQVQNIE